MRNIYFRLLVARGKFEIIIIIKLDLYNIIYIRIIYAVSRIRTNKNII